MMKDLQKECLEEGKGDILVILSNLITNVFLEEGLVFFLSSSEVRISFSLQK